MLGTARAYPALDLARSTPPDQTFFTLPRLGVLHYDARLGWGLATVSALSVLAVLVAYAALARRLGDVELALGFVIGWTALALVGATVVPVGGYLFQWPAATAALSWLGIAVARRADALLALPAFLAVVLLTRLPLLAFQAGGVAVLPELAIAAAPSPGARCRVVPR